MAGRLVFTPPEQLELESERSATHHRSPWARGRENPVAFSPSGPAMEFNLQFSRQSREIPTLPREVDNTPTWHPKLTLYRLLVISSTIGLGAAKAVTSYLNLTYASITLEWILGVVVFLILHILGVYEDAHIRRMAWLFEVDYLDYLWTFLHKFARIHRPHYTTDVENKSAYKLTNGQVPMTGYHLLVTLTAFIVGLTKSALLYANRQTEATIIECVFGAFVVIGLYWLGLYEASSTKVYPALFHVDHSAGVFYFATVGPWFGLHLIGISLAAALTYAFGRLTYAAYNIDWSIPTLPAFFGLMNKALLMTLPMIPCVSALACIFVLVENLANQFRASRLGRYLAQVPGLVIFTRIYDNYWLPTPPSHPKERFFYLKRVLIRQMIQFPRNLFFLFMIIAVLVICAWVTTQWIMVLILCVDTLWLFAWLLGSMVVVPAVRFYVVMMWGLLYIGVGRFLEDVKKDGGVDQLDNGYVPV